MAKIAIYYVTSLWHIKDAFEAKLIHSTEYIVLLNSFYEDTLWVIELENRCQKDAFSNQVFDNLAVLTERCAHDSVSLRVSNVIDFLVGYLIDVCENSWQIVLAHVLPRKLPIMKIRLEILCFLFLFGILW